MIGFLAKKLIDAMEKRLNSDMGYMRSLNAVSPRGFDKFLKATALSRHCEIVPPAASHAARLAAMSFEDCGSCLQIAVDQSRTAGLEDGVIRAVLEGKQEVLPPDAALAYHFARSILTRAADLEEIRQAVRGRWGEKGVVDLTMVTQGSRLYPMIKLGLGFAVSCQQVRIDTEMMRPG